MSCNDFSGLDFRLHCPYCGKLIFSIGSDVTSECEHLIFIHETYENYFEKATKELKSFYDDAVKLAEEDGSLNFEAFVEQYPVFSQHTVGIYIYDETNCYLVGIWFAFKPL